jgi:exodeoxyribonuclease VII large subunit
MRGRHAAELTASLRQAVTSSLGRSARRHQLLIRALDQFDPRHRLAAIRMRLVERDGALAKALTRRLHGADSRFKSVAGRLEGLSPLAVLGRGYAVAWDASRTRILRDAGSLTVGDRIRVTLEHGELGCEVVDPPASPAPDGHRAASGEPDNTETSKR